MTSTPQVLLTSSLGEVGHVTDGFTPAP